MYIIQTKLTDTSPWVRGKQEYETIEAAILKADNNFFMGEPYAVGVFDKNTMIYIVSEEEPDGKLLISKNQ